MPFLALSPLEYSQTVVLVKNGPKQPLGDFAKRRTDDKIAMPSILKCSESDRMVVTVMHPRLEADRFNARLDSAHWFSQNYIWS